jgi:hypothetical protein
MSDISETMFFSHHLCPFFNGAALNFNGIPATFADEMMMMGFTAQPVDSFTIISPQNINDLVINKTLQ